MLIFFMLIVFFFQSVLVILFFVDTDVSNCGNGWLDYKDGATCYKFSEVRMNWENAKKYCSDLNSALVVPKTAKEQLFLYGTCNIF